MGIRLGTHWATPQCCTTTSESAGTSRPENRLSTRYFRARKQSYRLAEGYEGGVVDTHQGIDERSLIVVLNIPEHHGREERRRCHGSAQNLVNIVCRRFSIAFPRPEEFRLIRSEVKGRYHDVCHLLVETDFLPKHFPERPVHGSRGKAGPKNAIKGQDLVVEGGPRGVPVPSVGNMRRVRQR